MSLAGARWSLIPEKPHLPRLTEHPLNLTQIVLLFGSLPTPVHISTMLVMGRTYCRSSGLCIGACTEATMQSAPSLTCQRKLLTRLPRACFGTTKWVS